MVAAVTMATAADIPTSVTMEVATTGTVVGRGATDGMAAITVGAVPTDTIVAMAGTAATAGAGDMDGVGGIDATVGTGDGVLDLGGRIGVGDGDIRIATTDTALGITLPTLTTTRIIVLRDTHVFPTGTMTRRLRIPAQTPGAIQQSLGGRR
jgi:hypothetical protein